MALTQCMVSSFKAELLGGTHDLDTDVIKIALYTSAATYLDATVTAYATTDEVVSSGGTPYVAGGNTLAGAAITLDGTTAIVDFTDSAWLSVSMTARAALIYNSSKSDKAIAVLDFGADKTSTLGNFTVVFPAAAAATAILRIA